MAVKRLVVGVCVVMLGFLLLGSQLRAAPLVNFDQQQFRDVAGGLRCPSCQGLSVLESDASFSVQIRDEVARQLASGKSKDEIYQFFVDRFGVWILREPPAQGWGALLWVLPLTLLALGVMWGAWLFLRAKHLKASPQRERSRAEILAEMQDRLRLLHATASKGR